LLKDVFVGIVGVLIDVVVVVVIVGGGGVSGSVVVFGGVNISIRTRGSSRWRY